MFPFQTPFSAQSRLSTANSTTGAAAYANMQLKTQVTLKSPFEGANLGPAPSKPQARTESISRELRIIQGDANLVCELPEALTLV